MVSNGRERWWAGADGDQSPHSVLGITRSATPDEIQAAYRKHMKECHPDLSNSNSCTKNEIRARQLNAAIEELREMHSSRPATHQAATHYRQRAPDRPVSSSERYAMFCERQPGRVMSARNNLRLRAFIMVTLMSIATYKRVFPDPDSPYYQPAKGAPPVSSAQQGPQSSTVAAVSTAAVVGPESRASDIATSVAETMQHQAARTASVQPLEGSVTSERWDRL